MSATVQDAALAGCSPQSAACRSTLHPAVLVLAVVTLTALSFFRFPGHTILQSDTQIYIPLLEHIWDPGTLSRDIMATRPHVSFTLYDEAALLLRAVSGASFENVLMGQQFVYRAVGIAGLYFLALALGLEPWKALLLAAVISLGATINGPAVLTVEYEPVPRGFAMPFVVASMAAVGYRKWTTAATLATIAFGFHPPTAVVYAALLGLLLIANRRIADLAVLGACPGLMLITALAFGWGPEPQPIFGRIDRELEQLQRLRGSYNWVSIWLSNWYAQYLLMLVVGAAAYWRMRGRISAPLTLIFLALPLVGVLAVPASYLLLEKAKWVFIPQFQPARYLLFVTFIAALLCAAAGLLAAERRRWIEALVLLTIAFAIPMDAKVLNVVLPGFTNDLASKRLGLAFFLAGISTLATARRSPAGIVLAGILPFMLIPSFGQVRNYAALHNSELDDLAQWARQNTPKDALFQFAGAGRELAPGVFRARAKRALYADWKAGGQVNFQKQFSNIWWERWQHVEKPQALDRYRQLGIDYVVFNARGEALPGVQPAYQNPRYIVFKVN